MAEATTLRFGLNLAQSFESFGCSRLIINSDNSDVIVAMQDGGTFSGLTAAIFDDCYHMVHDLSQIHYEHCHREGNSVAHELARIARFSPPGTWFNEAPNAISPMLVNYATLITT
ncbi:hypothetical protein VPH35_011235 [Triticum aestivum]